MNLKTIPMYKENVMRKDNLVTLKGSDVKTFGTDTMHPNRFYRSIKLTDENKGDVMVYGMTFNKKTFDGTFEFAYDKIIRDFKEMGLVKDNLTAIGKVKFMGMADIHKYGKYSVLVFGKSNKEIYAFYPMQGNKLDTLNESYRMLIDLIDGDMDLIDCKDIQFGNKLPIGYGDLTYR